MAGQWLHNECTAAELVHAGRQASCRRPCLRSADARACLRLLSCACPTAHCAKVRSAVRKGLAAGLRLAVQQRVSTHPAHNWASNSAKHPHVAGSFQTHCAQHTHRSPATPQGDGAAAAATHHDAYVSTCLPFHTVCLHSSGLLAVPMVWFGCPCLLPAPTASPPAAAGWAVQPRPVAPPPASAPILQVHSAIWGGQEEGGCLHGTVGVLLQVLPQLHDNTRQQRPPNHCSPNHQPLLKPSRRPAAHPRQRSSSEQRSCSNGGSVPQQRRGGPPAAQQQAADPGAAAQLQQLGLRGAAAPRSQQPFAARRRCVRALRHGALPLGSGLGGGGGGGSAAGWLMTCRVAHTRPLPPAATCNHSQPVSAPRTAPSALPQRRTAA